MFLDTTSNEALLEGSAYGNKNALALLYQRCGEQAYFRGYTHRDISELKQVPLETVQARIQIGMEKLRDLLTRRQPGGL